MYPRVSSAAALAAILLILAPCAARAGDQDTSNGSVVLLAQADGPMVITPQPNPNGPHATSPNSLPPPSGESGYDAGGPGTPYEPAPGSGAYVPPEAQSQDTFSMDEIKETGHRFFGRVSMDLARVIEYAFQRSGRPNGYILGEEAGGAFVAGLRYGEGTLYTKNAGDLRVYWQGPSVGFDWGGDGARTMTLVYNLPATNAIYQRFVGIDGSAYIVGGFGMTALTSNNIVLVPIRSGIGLRLGANVGYLKFTPRATWNPF